MSGHPTGRMLFPGECKCPAIKPRYRIKQFSLAAFPSCIGYEYGYVMGWEYLDFRHVLQALDPCVEDMHILNRNQH